MCEEVPLSSMSDVALVKHVLERDTVSPLEFELVHRLQQHIEFADEEEEDLQWE